MENSKTLKASEAQSPENEAFESFSLAFSDNTFVQESCKLVENVFDEPGLVTDDASKEGSLAVVGDTMVGVVDNVAGFCDIGLEFENLEGNELGVVSQGVGGNGNGSEKVGLVDNVVEDVDSVQAQNDVGSEVGNAGIGGTEDCDLLTYWVDGEIGYQGGFEKLTLDDALVGNGDKECDVEDIVIKDGMRKEEQSRMSDERAEFFGYDGSHSVELPEEANCDEQVGSERRLHLNEATDVSLVAIPSDDGTRLLESRKAYSDCEDAEETRVRRKSKYLSYPYVNSTHNGFPRRTKYASAPKVSPGSGNSHADRFVGSASITKPCSSEILKRKWAEKFMTKDTVSCSPELVSVSSAELLSELLSTAVDCLYPLNNDNFDTVELFILRFRNSVYHDESIYETPVKIMVGQNEALAASNHMELTSKLKPRSQKKQVTLTHAKATHIQNADKLAEKGSRILLETGYDDPENETKHMIELERANKISGNKVPTGLLDVNISFDPSGLCMEGFAGLSAVRSERKRRKKSKEVTLTYDHLDLHMSNALPCGVQDANRNKAGSIFLYVDLQLPGPSSLDIIPRNQLTTGHLNHYENKVNTSSFVEDPPIVCPFTAKGKHMKSGRKRKYKAVVNCSDTGVFDSNGTSKLPNSSENKLPEADSVLLVKQEKKRLSSGKRKAKGREKNSALSMLDRISTNDTRDTNGNVLGTAVLVTFAEGAITPSKEVLVEAFSKFGPLKESETQLLKDSDTARVVFIKRSDAIEAFQNLEKCNPFDATVASYSLHQCSAASLSSKPENTSLAYEDAVTTVAKSCDPMSDPNGGPPLEIIKKNLYIMTEMVKESSANLSPETREKLKGEVKDLLMEVSNMAGCLSSS